MRSGSGRSLKSLVRLLRFIGHGALLKRDADGVAIEQSDGRQLRATAILLRQAMAAGLVAISPADTDTPVVADSSGTTQSVSAAAQDRSPGEAGDGQRLSLLPAARSFLRRMASDAEEAFLAQHADIVSTVADIGGVRQAVRLDRTESPLAALARLKDRNGEPFMPDEALAAGERLAADFTRGQLQPRVTASWEPKLSSASSGSRGGMADLADSAIAARLAVNRAAGAMGPELSGVALDICCFMKGLATVERERQWPARSAKLMLRAALLVLARHYAPPPREKSVRPRHWGAEGYRPDW